MAARYASSSDESDGPHYEIDYNNLVYNSDGEAVIEIQRGNCYPHNDIKTTGESSKSSNNQSRSQRFRHSSSRSAQQIGNSSGQIRADNQDNLHYLRQQSNEQNWNNQFQQGPNLPNQFQQGPNLPNQFQQGPNLPNQFHPKFKENLLPPRNINNEAFNANNPLQSTFILPDGYQRNYCHRGGAYQIPERGRGTRGRGPTDRGGSGRGETRGRGPTNRGGSGRGDSRGRGSTDRGGPGRGDTRGRGPTDRGGSRGRGPTDRGGSGRGDSRGRGPRDRGGPGRGGSRARGGPRGRGGSRRSSVSSTGTSRDNNDKDTESRSNDGEFKRTNSHDVKPNISEETNNEPEILKSDSQILEIEVSGNVPNDFFNDLEAFLSSVNNYSRIANYHDTTKNVTYFLLKFDSKKQAFKAKQILNSKKLDDKQLKAILMSDKNTESSHDTHDVKMTTSESNDSEIKANTTIQTNVPPIAKALFLIMDGRILIEKFEGCFTDVKSMQSYEAKHDGDLNITIVTLIVLGKKNATLAKAFLLSPDTLHSKLGRVINCANGLVEYNAVINKLKSTPKVLETDMKPEDTWSSLNSDLKSGQRVFVRVDGEIPDNFGEYLPTRMTESVDFKYLNEENEYFPEFNRSVTVLLFSSKNKAVRAMRIFHESNKTCPTKLLCRLHRHEIDLCDRQMQSEEKNQSVYDKHKREIQRRTTDHLKGHADKITIIQRELKSVNDKIHSQRNMSLDEFSYLDDQRKALDAKVIELECQTKEFERYTDDMWNVINSLKNEDDFEKKLLQIRSYFGVECRRFATALPMYAKRKAIIEQVKECPVSIVIGETGSGKSTQMVQYLHDNREMIFSHPDSDSESINKPIVCTQPRKIAAMTVAKRVADEMNVSFGDTVAFQNNIYTKRSEKNKIIFMTDYVLLHECAKDPNLNAFSCVIIDEAHERSVYTDLLIAMLKRSLVLSKRTDLRIIITSATIDPKVFVKFFEPLDCPVLHVSGRAFPVEIVWNESDDEIDFKDQTRKAVTKAFEVHSSNKKTDLGAILVFVTTPNEAEECCEQFKSLSKGQNDCFCLPLHGKLQQQDQQKVFTPCPPRQRKIVFATNAAETSVTIPEVKYVIDTGLVKEMEYDAVRNMNTLNVNLVTQSSADQRKGRAGRTGPGKCYRLYSLNTYQNMSANSKPEILRIHLGLALIKLLVLRIDPENFDFVDSPPKEMLDAAFDSLEDLGAINDKEITILGEWLGKLPFDPYIGAIVYHGVQEGIPLISLIFAALASAPGSVFYSGGNDNEQRKEANKLRLKFCDEDGDLFSYFKAFRAWHQTPERNKKRFSMENSLNNKVLSQVQDTIKEIRNTLKKDMKVNIEFRPDDPLEIDEHKSAIKCFLLRIFRRKLCHYLGHRKAGYLSLHQDQILHLFPTCSLKSLGLECDWLIYTYAMQTSYRYGMNVTLIAEEDVVEAIDNGTIDLDIEEVKKRRMKECCLEMMGRFTFNEFVGPRFTLLRKIESDFQSGQSECTIVLEADRDQGTLRFLCNSTNPAVEESISNSIKEKVRSIRQRFLLEQEEQAIAGAFRAVFGCGGSVSHILTPEEFCNISIHASPADFQNITKDLVQESFGVFGRIVSIRCTQKSRNRSSTLWGFITYSLPEEAKRAVEENEITSTNSITLTAKQEGLYRPKNDSEKFKVKLSWTRRISKGCAVVKFTEIENAGAALVSPIHILGQQVYVKTSKFDIPGEIFMHKINLSADESDIKEGIARALHLNNHQNEFERVIIMRQDANENDDDIKTFKKRLRALVKMRINNDSFEIEMINPRPKTASYIAFVTFQNAADGIKACREFNNEVTTIDNKVLNVKPVLSNSIFISKRVYSSTKETLDSFVDQVNDDELNRGTAELKTLKSGNFAIDLNVDDDVEYFLETKSSIDEVVNGYRLTCEMDPELKHVFSNQGRRLITNLEESTKTCILMDCRTLSLSIHGSIDNRMQVINALREYQNEMVNSAVKRVKLAGEGLPSKVAKVLMERFGADCSELAESCHLISCEVNLKDQLLILTGNEEAIDKATVEVNEIINFLKDSQNIPALDDNYPDCPICFCPVDNEIYRLEACGHAYHLSCSKLHLENAVKSREFPLSCTSAECNVLIALSDVKQIAQQGPINLDEVIKSSISCFVKKNLGNYHYCKTPDCDAVYRKSENGKKFQCPICNLLQCTTCLVQWHYGITCEQWKSQDKDVSVEQWIRENPENRKRCPQCKAPIEKNGGCNHMTCPVCKRHICWHCLKHYESSRQCYAHLQARHGGAFQVNDILNDDHQIHDIPAPVHPEQRNILNNIRAAQRLAAARPAEPYRGARPPTPPLRRERPIYNDPPRIQPVHHYRPPPVRHEPRQEQNGCLIL